MLRLVLALSPLLALVGCDSSGVPKSFDPSVSSLYRHFGVNRFSRPLRKPSAWQFVQLVHVRNGVETIVGRLGVPKNATEVPVRVEVISSRVDASTSAYTLHLLGDGVEKGSAPTKVSFASGVVHWSLSDTRSPLGVQTLLASGGPSGESDQIGDPQHSDELILRLVPKP